MCQRYSTPMHTKSASNFTQGTDTNSHTNTSTQNYNLTSVPFTQVTVPFIEVLQLASKTVTIEFYASKNPIKHVSSPLNPF